MHTQNDNRSGVSRHSVTRRELAINLPNEQGTTEFAERLASVLKHGLVISMHGDLGSGKTTLVRGLLHALGYQGRVKSPTYTLLEQYEAGGFDLRHFDLYRFQDYSEWEAAGFNDEFDGRNTCLVEWPEMAGTLLPQADIEIFFEILPDGRNIRIVSNTNTGSECINNL